MKTYPSAARAAWAVFVALFALIALSPSATAQNCRPVSATVILTSGAKKAVFKCMSNWAGVSASAIGAGGDRSSESIARTEARLICDGACPAKLPAAVSVDTIVWKNGQRSTGNVEINCRDNDCTIIQGGKAAAGHWYDVSYIVLAPR